MSTEQRNTIRGRMRRQRCAVSPSDRAIAASRLCDRLANSPFFRSAQYIGGYFPSDGEIDIWPVLEHAWRLNKSVYLPVIMPDRTLNFALMTAEMTLTRNRFGIPEPHNTNELRSAAYLDLVLMPLVAFDDRLYRLGMGGGYYDKTFEFVSESGSDKPLLIGIAYDFQHVGTVFPMDWDVPASHIFTDQASY